MNNARRSFANVCLTESDTLPPFLSAFLTETKGRGHHSAHTMDVTSLSKLDVFK